ncbi:MAG: hypothetical protein HQK51_18095, partial [Oligoflexia bacterium]|nr:hypothetical protein [Oligoflexia bacterium]
MKELDFIRWLAFEAREQKIFIPKFIFPKGIIGNLAGYCCGLGNINLGIKEYESSIHIWSLNCCTHNAVIDLRKNKKLREPS